MLIELKNIKYAAFASEETSCFEAKLYLNGKPRGSVSNEGHGGPNFFTDREAESELDAYGATLPERTADVGGGHTFTYKQDGESLVNALLEQHLTQREYRRKIKDKVLFTKKGAEGIWQTRKLTPVQMAAILAAPEKHLKDFDKVLNKLPEAEGIALMFA